MPPQGSSTATIGSMPVSRAAAFPGATGVATPAQTKRQLELHQMADTVTTTTRREWPSLALTSTYVQAKGREALNQGAKFGSSLAAGAQQLAERSYAGAAGALQKGVNRIKLGALHAATGIDLSDRVPYEGLLALESLVREAKKNVLEYDWIPALKEKMGEFLTAPEPFFQKEEVSEEELAPYRALRDAMEDFTTTMDLGWEGLEAYAKKFSTLLISLHGVEKEIGELLLSTSNTEHQVRRRVELEVKNSLASAPAVVDFSLDCLNSLLGGAPVEKSALAMWFQFIRSPEVLSYVLLGTEKPAQENQILFATTLEKLNSLFTEIASPLKEEIDGTLLLSDEEEAFVLQEEGRGADLRTLVQEVKTTFQLAQAEQKGVVVRAVQEGAQSLLTATTTRASEAGPVAEAILPLVSGSVAALAGIGDERGAGAADALLPAATGVQTGFIGSLFQMALQNMRGVTDSAWQQTAAVTVQTILGGLTYLKDTLLPVQGELSPEAKERTRKKLESAIAYLEAHKERITSLQQLKDTVKEIRCQLDGIHFQANGLVEIPWLTEAVEERTPPIENPEITLGRHAEALAAHAPLPEGTDWRAETADMLPTLSRRLTYFSTIRTLQWILGVKESDNDLLAEQVGQAEEAPDKDKAFHQALSRYINENEASWWRRGVARLLLRLGFLEDLGKHLGSFTSSLVSYTQGKLDSAKDNPLSPLGVAPFKESTGFFRTFVQMCERFKVGEGEGVQGYDREDALDNLAKRGEFNRHLGDVDDVYRQFDHMLLDEHIPLPSFFDHPLEHIRKRMILGLLKRSRLPLTKNIMGSIRGSLVGDGSGKIVLTAVRDFLGQMLELMRKPAEGGEAAFDLPHYPKATKDTMRRLISNILEVLQYDDIDVPTRERRDRGVWQNLKEEKLLPHLVDNIIYLFMVGHQALLQGDLLDQQVYALLDATNRSFGPPTPEIEEEPEGNAKNLESDIDHLLTQIMWSSITQGVDGVIKSLGQDRRQKAQAHVEGLKEEFGKEEGKWPPDDAETLTATWFDQTSLEERLVLIDTTLRPSLHTMLESLRTRRADVRGEEAFNELTQKQLFERLEPVEKDMSDLYVSFKALLEGEKGSKTLEEVQAIYREVMRELSQSREALHRALDDERLPIPSLNVERITSLLAGWKERYPYLTEEEKTLLSGEKQKIEEKLGQLNERYQAATAYRERLDLHNRVEQAFNGLVALKQEQENLEPIKWGVSSAQRAFHAVKRTVHQYMPYGHVIVPSIDQSRKERVQEEMEEILSRLDRVAASTLRSALMMMDQGNIDRARGTLANVRLAHTVRKDELFKEPTGQIEAFSMELEESFAQFTAQCTEFSQGRLASSKESGGATLQRIGTLRKTVEEVLPIDFFNIPLIGNEANVVKGLQKVTYDETKYIANGIVGLLVNPTVVEGLLRFNLVLPSIDS